jgi:anti-anti-sigma factor
VKSRTLGTTAEIVVTGEIDIASIRQVAVAIRTALRLNPERLVIDLEQVEFLDSICMRMLRKTSGLANAAGSEIVILPPTGLARRPFDFVEPGTFEPRAPIRGSGRTLRPPLGAVMEDYINQISRPAYD